MSNNLFNTWTEEICDGNDQFNFIIYCQNYIKSAKIEKVFTAIINLLFMPFCGHYQTAEWGIKENVPQCNNDM